MSEDDFSEKGLSRPEWERVRVVSRATDQSHITKAGDPTLWGKEVRTNLTNNPAAGMQIVSEQFVRVQSADAYARIWSITGTLRMLQASWIAPNQTQVVVGAPPPNVFGVALEIRHGAGQNTLVHFADLRALTTIGLQVYFPYVDVARTPAFALQETRAFALYSQIVATAISMRVIYSLGQGVILGANPYADVSINVAPLAPGHGM